MAWWEDGVWWEDGMRGRVCHHHGRSITPRFTRLTSPPSLYSPPFGRRLQVVKEFLWPLSTANEMEREAQKTDRWMAVDASVR